VAAARPYVLAVAITNSVWRAGPHRARSGRPARQQGQSACRVLPGL